MRRHNTKDTRESPCFLYILYLYIYMIHKNSQQISRFKLCKHWIRYFQHKVTWLRIYLYKSQYNNTNTFKHKYIFSISAHKHIIQTFFYSMLQRKSHLWKWYKKKKWKDETTEKFRSKKKREKRNPVQTCAVVNF